MLFDPFTEIFGLPTMNRNFLMSLLTNAYHVPEVCHCGDPDNCNFDVHELPKPQRDEPLEEWDEESWGSVEIKDVRE